MAKYLLEVSYTLEGIKGLKAEGGSARRKVAEDAVKSLGGSIEAFYFAFGGADVYLVADMPGQVDAAALSLAVCAGGGVRAKTVVLLTAQEMDEAARRSVEYRPPGA